LLNIPDVTYFQRKSAETDFHAPELEKIYRLSLMLTEINRGPLKEYLALRGGTAINLCYNQLPRLSVDIDLALIRDGNKERMQADRTYLRTQLPAIAKAQNYEVQSDLSDYSLDQFRLKYRNSFQAPDSITVEVNYIAARVPIDPPEFRKLYDIFELSPIPVQTLSAHEIYGSKIEALVKRHAPRDLFDVYEALQAGNLSTSELRPRTLFSCCVEIPYDFRNTLTRNPADPITQKQANNELRPCLRKNKEFNLEEAKGRVGGFCQELFTLDPDQEQFLNDFFDKGQYEPELLFDNKPYLRNHPGIMWRLQQLNRGNPQHPV